MTLDIRQLIKNSIEKQFKISHLADSVELDVFNKAAIPEEIVASIKASYGEEYLGDSTYVAFFKTPGTFDKKLIGRLFKAVDSALGNDANRLTDEDFKRLELDKMGDIDQPAVEPTDTDDSFDTDVTEPDIDAEIQAELGDDEIPEETSDNDDAVADALNEDDEEETADEEKPSEDDKKEDAEDDSSDDGSEDDEANDSSEKSSEDEPEDTPAADLPKTAVFLKITTK